MVIDPRNPERTFLCYSRDTDGEALKLWFNADNNSFDSLSAKDFGKESAKENEKERGLRERIVNVLRLNQPRPLSGREIIELMEFDPKSNEGRGIYTALGRLVARRILIQQRSSCPQVGDRSGASWYCDVKSVLVKALRSGRSLLRGKLRPSPTLVKLRGLVK